MELVQLPEGYWQIKNMPTMEELEKYYSQEHYQQARGSYESCYSDEERHWKKTEQDLIVSAMLEVGTFSRCLDIGCGEGYLMNAFFEQNCQVTGVDFSSYGIQKENPHLVDNFKQADIYEFIENEDLASYDCLSLMNVIEHVRNPRALLTSLFDKMTDNTLLAITFPNDFSLLQSFLQKKNKIDKEFWISLPRHLSYFNTISMEKFLNNIGFKIHSKIANFPIDFQLLNDNSNYILDPSKGKNTHHYRVALHNLLYDTDKTKYLTILKTLAEMGFGRNVTFVCKKHNVS